MDARHYAHQVWRSMHDNTKNKVRVEIFGHPTNIFELFTSNVSRKARTTSAFFSSGIMKSSLEARNAVSPDRPMWTLSIFDVTCRATVLPNGFGQVSISGSNATESE
jgi:hypothetical protein